MLHNEFVPYAMWVKLAEGYQKLVLITNHLPVSKGGIGLLLLLLLPLLLLLLSHFSRVRLCATP